MLEDIIPRIIIVVCCIIASSFFSASETAFLSLNRARLKSMAEKGNKKASQVLALSEEEDRILWTIMIGNIIANTVMAIMGTIIFVKFLGYSGVILSAFVIIATILIFGEITPKNIAKNCPEDIAMFSLSVIKFCIVLFTPLSVIFSFWNKMISSLLKLENDSKMSQQELLMLVEEVQQEGSIDSTESSLLRNAIEFTDRKASDILTHRVDIEAVSIDDTKEEVAKVFTESGFSRLLVYSDSLDSIVGVIHQKDFYVNGGMTEKSLGDIMVPPLYIHKSEKISDLLALLQTKKSHIAVVIDEYGGTIGIVTMEDILEELVGDIWDEHDEVIEKITEISDGSFMADCSVYLSDFCEYFDIAVDSDSLSLGGWITEQLGLIPEEGEVFDYENLRIKITEVDTNRVASVNIIVYPKSSLNGSRDSENLNQDKNNEKSKSDRGGK